MDYFSGLFFAMAEAEPASIRVKRNFPFYHGLQYVYSGKFVLRLDQKEEFHLAGPVVFLTSPRRYFEYWNDGTEPRHHLWCCFQGPRVERMIEGGLFPADAFPPVFTPPDPEDYLLRMRELIALASSVRAGDNDRAVMRLEELLFRLQEPAADPGILPSPRAEHFEALLAGIERHPEQAWDFDKEARRLFISLNHFNRLFRAFCRTSPHRAVLDARMRRAAGLLLETHDSIREIAFAVGIDNEFYFSRLFKQRYRLAPLAYRREFRGN
ncbi:AraC family transcriptional regulator [Victivallis vadensis]|uniref:helix-turn-helix transcriptional regulator n=1 Tax=Victivallis vadensis TaxID=172901 RepID=UPI00307ED157